MFQILAALAVAYGALSLGWHGWQIEPIHIRVPHVVGPTRESFFGEGSEREPYQLAVIPLDKGAGYADHSSQDRPLDQVFFTQAHWLYRLTFSGGKRDHTIGTPRQYFGGISYGSPIPRNPLNDTSSSADIARDDVEQNALVHSDARVRPEIPQADNNMRPSGVSGDFVSVGSADKGLSPLVNGLEERPQPRAGHKKGYDAYDRSYQGGRRGALLCAQVLFGVCLFFGGLYALLYALDNVRRLSVKAGALYSGLGAFSMAVGALIATFAFAPL